ncbi:MAG: DegQ family serine endoprotease [Rhodospirillales bacterium]|nr:DegQ family serine endoprotease [Rhodospirillales bacterium]
MSYYRPLKRQRQALAAVLLVGSVIVAPLAAPKAAARSGPEGFADLIEEASPAVVQITATGSAPMRHSMEGSSTPLPDQFGEGPFKEFFERFFHDRAPNGPHGKTDPMPPAKAAGSGFIIDQAGIVVTNNHVIRGADDIQITLKDGRSVAAKIIGTDEKTDLAVLKVESDGPLPVVRWGNSDDTRVGDWVVAVGNPYGLEGTVTAGIVSARGRDLGSGPYDDFIQIDAPINRGNSGGPLFDGSGEVIGVNTAIFSPNGGNVGIGFAIPSNIAAQVVAELREKGVVERGFLGVMIQPVTPEIAETLGLGEARGALVAQVTDQSAAARAGIERGDIVLRFAGQDIQEPRDLSRSVASADVGERKDIDLWRGGKQMTLSVELGRLPNETAAAQTDEAGGRQLAELGITVAPLDDNTRSRFDIEDGANGVVIVGVDEATDAARKGLRPGDVIAVANQRPVSTPADLLDIVDQAKTTERRAVLLLIERTGKSRFVAVRLADV